MNLNIDKLKGHIPEFVIIQIPETAIKFNITTNLELTTKCKLIFVKVKRRCSI